MIAGVIQPPLGRNSGLSQGMVYRGVPCFS